MDTTRPKDLITTREAIKILHISPSTMSRLIKDGVLNHYTDLLDKRVKLVSRIEVEALKAQSRKAA
jgi:DNA-binding MarR family transcriptional regulator